MKCVNSLLREKCKQQQKTVRRPAASQSVTHYIHSWQQSCFSQVPPVFPTHLPPLSRSFPYSQESPVIYKAQIYL